MYFWTANFSQTRPHNVGPHVSLRLVGPTGKEVSVRYDKVSKRVVRIDKLAQLFGTVV